MSNNDESEEIIKSFISDLKEGTLTAPLLTETAGTTEHQNRKLAACEVLAIVNGGLLGNSELYEWNPFSKTEKRNCPNGEVRTVLKNPNQAFELYQTNWSLKMNAVVDVLNQISVKLDVDVQKQIVPLFQALNAMNGKAQQDYNAAYQVYASAPCNDAVLAWWMNITERIMNQSDKLSLFQTQLTAAMQYPQALEKALQNVHEQVKLLIAEQMPERPKNIG